MATLAAVVAESDGIVAMMVRMMLRGKQEVEGHEEDNNNNNASQITLPKTEV